MVHYSAFLGSLLVLFLCFASPASARTPEKTIDDICHLHKDPPFCLSVINEKNGPKLSMQVQYAVATAIVNASDSKDMITALIGSTNDASLKEHYQKCETEYGNAFLSLAEASKRMDKGQFAMVVDATKSVSTSLDNCDKTVPSGGTSAIKKNIDDLRSINQIIQIASDILVKGKGGEGGGKEKEEEEEEEK